MDKKNKDHETRRGEKKGKDKRQRIENLLEGREMWQLKNDANRFYK